VKNFKSGALIAIAAGGLFATACKKENKTTESQAVEQPAPAPAPTPEADKPADPAVAPAEGDKPAQEQVAKVDCAGVNACKGQGTCKTEKHGCGGQNACKGQGVVAMTEEECKEKGGTVANK
jgi:hypothetical protein